MNDLIHASLKEYFQSKQELSPEEFASKYSAEQQDVFAKTLDSLQNASILSSIESSLRTKDNLTERYRQVQMERLYRDNYDSELKEEIRDTMTGDDSVGKDLTLLRLKHDLYLSSFAQRNALIDEVLRAFGSIEDEIKTKVEKHSRDVYIVKYAQFETSAHLTSHWALKIGTQIHHLRFNRDLRVSVYSKDPYRDGNAKQLSVDLVGQTDKSDEEIEEILSTIAKNHIYSSATDNCQTFVLHGQKLIVLSTAKYDFFNTRDLLLMALAFFGLMLIIVVAVLTFYIGKNQAGLGPKL